MNKKSLKEGDEVVLICDDSIIYTILTVYGNAHTICKYTDPKTRKPMEISIPLVALKINKPMMAP